MEENQPNDYSIKDTNATKRIFSLKKRIRAVAGGTAASKTVSILIWLIDYCQSIKNAGKLVTVVSESYPHLHAGAVRDFQIIMKDRGYWNDDRWNKRGVYTFETEAVLEFISVNTYSKAHGPRRHVLFINECNNLAYNIVDQLITRTKETIWLDWNPTSEFWFYSDMLVNREKDLDFITLTYKDNDALDQGTIDEIESHKNNKQWWNVYGEGKLGEVEERVFTGWALIPEIPHEAKLFRYGLDFGFSNDPAALIATYQYNGAYIFDQMLYRKGLFNKMIADFLKNVPYALTKADSVEPKSIKEIASFGVPIIGARKGKDSIRHGIKYLQSQKIFITERSLDLIREYRNYLWVKDTNGRITDIAQDYDNHCLDACRYSLDDVIEKFIFSSAPKQNTGAYLLEVLRQQNVQPDSYYS